jgi:hypothetical protein
MKTEYGLTWILVPIFLVAFLAWAVFVMIFGNRRR